MSLRSFLGCFKRIFKRKYEVFVPLYFLTFSTFFSSHLVIVNCHSNSVKGSEATEAPLGILGELTSSQDKKDPPKENRSSSVKSLPVPESTVHFDISQNVYVAPQDIIRNAGYPAEIHEVTTEDGYILTLFRIPPTSTESTQTQQHTSELNSKSKGGKPVYIGHGILSTAADWLMIDPSRALPFQLANAGFDVWLGNCRGSDYSFKHTKYSNASETFWDFSFHEMGKYDLPAIIDYILQKTRFDSINYVGYSKSVTSFFILMSERPEYNVKVNKMVALAPAIYISNIQSPAKLLASITDESTLLILHKILSSGRLATHELANMFSKVVSICGPNEVTYEDACENLLFILTGVNPKENTNRTVIKRLKNYSPAVTSSRTVIHYVQFIKTPEFRQYDWGTRNPIYYNGATHPPKYHLNRTKVNMLFIYGGSDNLAVPEDVMKIVQELKESNPNIESITVDPYNHLDFVFADSVAQLVYGHITKFYGS